MWYVNEEKVGDLGALSNLPIDGRQEPCVVEMWAGSRLCGFLAVRTMTTDIFEKAFSSTFRRGPHVFSGHLFLIVHSHMSGISTRACRVVIIYLANVRAFPLTIEKLGRLGPGTLELLPMQTANKFCGVKYML